MDEEASLPAELACLPSSSLHYSYTLVEKEPYLMSTSPYKLYIKDFYFSCASNSSGFYKNHVQQIVDSYKLLSDCYIG